MSNKKNLLIYAHYYIPDTASTGQILRELAEGMLDKFNITIICVVPSYLGTIRLRRQQVKATDKQFFIQLQLRNLAFFIAFSDGGFYL